MLLMAKIAAIRIHLPVACCFRDLESWNFKNLLLIRF